MMVVVGPNEVLRTRDYLPIKLWARVLGVLYEARQPVRAGEIRTRLGVSSTHTHRALWQLKRWGLVVPSWSLTVAGALYATQHEEILNPELWEPLCLPKCKQWTQLELEPITL